MKCPVCGDPELVMSERQGIEIDYCPKCRGVWLDRGELDKMVERSVTAEEQHRAAAPLHRSEDDDRHRRGYKRKRGFLGEIFDFD